jgi:hydrogenase-1 operon protein HyaF
MAELLSRLAEIPIRIEAPAPAPAAAAAAYGGLGGGVAALLTELASLLDRLANTQLPAAIDLHSLPMSPADRSELQRALGEGEVRATVHTHGLSTVRETRIGGVWWVEHRDAQGEVLAELLEVAQVPAILSRAIDEIAAAARSLREYLQSGDPLGARREA